MAVGISVKQLALEIGLDVHVEPDTTIAMRLHRAASSIINRYAPCAPEFIADEAAVRFAGYLHGSSASNWGAHRKQDIGGIAIEHPMNFGLGFRNSGAKSLLAPYKVRNAGTCSPSSSAPTPGIARGVLSILEDE